MRLIRKLLTSIWKDTKQSFNSELVDAYDLERVDWESLLYLVQILSEWKFSP